MTLRFEIRQATLDQLKIIICLIDDAADWLRREKNTDQWSRPWPSPERREARIRDGLAAGRTWLLWDGGRPAGTVTVGDGGHPEHWTAGEREIAAVYLHRLVISRTYSGRGVGAALLRWAEGRGRRENPRARLTRLSAWTDNVELHNYYKRHGFRPVGIRGTSDNAPDGALFDRPISSLPWHGSVEIVER